MHTALARGDVDAYVGAEPAPGVSISTGVGKIVEYPYSTPMGSLNMILAAHRDTVAAKPDLALALLRLQRQAAEFIAAHPDEMVAMTVAKLGQKKDAVAISVGNVEINWQMTPLMQQEAKVYAQQMLELKQIRAVPDMDALMDKRFSDELAHAA
jgi:NitT/TauT family transport system substrate-binding protein